MEQVVLEPVVRGVTRPGYRYFAPGSAVVSEGDRRQVFVGGTLVGEFAAGDQAACNALLVQLCQDPRAQGIGARSSSAGRWSASSPRGTRPPATRCSCSSARTPAPIGGG